MKPSTVLKKARKLIELGWCRDFYAVDKNGRVVGWDSDSACRWCMSGALARVHNKEGSGGAYEYLTSVIPGTHGDVVDFNDAQKSKRPVLAAFDRAIKLAEQEGQ